MLTQPADLLAYGLLACFALGLLLTAATALGQRLRSARLRVHDGKAPTPVPLPRERDRRPEVGARG